MRDVGQFFFSRSAASGDHFSEACTTTQVMSIPTNNGPTITILPKSFCTSQQLDKATSTISRPCCGILGRCCGRKVVAVGFADLGLGFRSRCCRDCLANHGLRLVVLASHHLAMAWVAWGLQEDAGTTLSKINGAVIKIWYIANKHALGLENRIDIMPIALVPALPVPILSSRKLPNLFFFVTFDKLEEARLPFRTVALKYLSSGSLSLF